MKEDDIDDLDSQEYLDSLKKLSEDIKKLNQESIERFSELNK